MNFNTYRRYAEKMQPPMDMSMRKACGFGNTRKSFVGYRRYTEYTMRPADARDKSSGDPFGTRPQYDRMWAYSLLNTVEHEPHEVSHAGL